MCMHDLPGFCQAKQDGSVVANGHESTSWGDDDSSVFDMAIVRGIRSKGSSNLRMGMGKTWPLQS